MDRGLVPGTHRGAPAPGETHGTAGPVEVRRSRRRRRTVSAYREDGRTVVLIPARFSRAEERRWVEAMLAKLADSDRRRRPSDDQLMARATDLSARYLGGLAKPASVRWVSNQRGRWGSCTPADASIRLSDRLKGMPPYVVDYVLLHELAHLLWPGHDRSFWALLQGYSRLERARGYLEGIAAGARLEMDDTDDDTDDEPDDVPDDEATADGYDAPGGHPASREPVTREGQLF